MHSSSHGGFFNINAKGNLCFDGVDLSDIAAEFGTPAYVMSENVLRQNARAFLAAMRRHFGENCNVAYASKALSAGFIYPILQSEGLHTDVVSGGELFTALRAGFPAERLHFHGNNKTEGELEYAVAAGIGSVIIDNYNEICLLDEIAARHNTRVKALMRVKPGIEAHTHEAVRTGHIDCKFGFGIADGEAMRVARAIASAGNLNFHGIHCHIGSQIFGGEAYHAAAGIMLELMADIGRELGVRLRELILGGGFGVSYDSYAATPAPEEVIESIACAVKENCRKHSLDMPEIVIEPGRSIVADAGVTLYTVGGVKDIEGARRYVSVDGGMTDNPRHALYKSQYLAEVVNKARGERDTVQTIAGRCCESGDIVTSDALFQRAEAGDLLCVYKTGAYNYSMASNYNRVPRPPIVLIRSDGKLALAVRRETYEDVARCDVL